MLIQKTREMNGKKENPTYALIDSQSVKTVYNSEKRGFDRGKKRKDESGRVVTDSIGNLLAISVRSCGKYS